MKRITAISIAVVVALAGVAVAAGTAATIAASEPQAEQYVPVNKQKHPMPYDLRELGLNETQQAKIHAILEEGRLNRERSKKSAKRAETEQKIQARRNTEQQLLLGDKFDEAAAKRLTAERLAAYRSSAAEREQRFAEAEMRRLKQRYAVLQVLTPQQRQQWLDIQNRSPAAPHGGHYADGGLEPREGRPPYKHPHY
ncbi:Spy/CpxP family protein refolding chaperone [Neisseria sp.]|uniref:Spy/CpxP family protein refolding chaperone n=1 Tax=Neisseria sp. TaxID=192066 RepID=UPI00359FB4EB